jgi:hypothetical protein
MVYSFVHSRYGGTADSSMQTRTLGPARVLAGGAPSGDDRVRHLVCLQLWAMHDVSQQLHMWCGQGHVLRHCMVQGRSYTVRHALFAAAAALCLTGVLAVHTTRLCHQTCVCCSAPHSWHNA